MHGLTSLVTKSAAAWPVTILWITGTITIFGVAESWFGWPVGLLIFLLVTLGVLVTAALREVHRELAEIHSIVNGHRDGLVRRTEILERALRDARVAVPDEGREEARIR